MTRLIFALSFLFLCVSAEFLTKKICKEVGSKKCNIHNVQMEPCVEGPSFCSVRRNKPYPMTVDFTPRFSSSSLRLAMYGDDDNSSNFSKVIKVPQSACSMLSCPVHADSRRIFDVDFSLDKSFGFGKYPVKVKIWNEEDESEVCCFTFNVKVHK